MNILTELLNSKEPIISYKASVISGKFSEKELQNLQMRIPDSDIIHTLFSELDSSGKSPYHPYKKWHGAHWLLYSLSDLDYPSGNKSLMPLLEQEYEWLLSERHSKLHLKIINNLVRRCASQEAVAVYAALKLGLNDDRTEELVRRLIAWQWPDGGWNCDKNPQASKSSFMESLLPLRALSLHAKLTGNNDSAQVSKRAAEIFLKRYLFKKQSDGSVINENFIKLHFPCYWHYDILCGLKVLGETGFIADERCKEALDLLETKMLANGGFPAEAKYYQLLHKDKTAYSLVNWGGISKKKMNEFVTVEALGILKMAGRLKL